MISITWAEKSDIDFIVSLDSHISREMIEKKIVHKEVLIVFDGNTPVGYLRYNLFWDEIPFMNLLWVIESHRDKKIGSQLVEFWEKEMKKHDYDRVMTSSLENENAQHFYRKLGYNDIGSFTPEEDEVELLFAKDLS